METTQVIESVLEINEKEVDGVVVFNVVGDLIIMSAGSLRGKVDKSIQNNKIKIVLNLVRVNFLDAHGIGIIVKAYDKINNKRGRFAVVLNWTLFDTFKKCCLDEFLKIFVCEDEEEAEKVKEAINWTRGEELEK